MPKGVIMNNDRLVKLLACFQQCVIALEDILKEEVAPTAEVKAAEAKPTEAPKVEVKPAEVKTEEKTTQAPKGEVKSPAEAPKGEESGATDKQLNFYKGLVSQVNKLHLEKNGKEKYSQEAIQKFLPKISADKKLCFKAIADLKDLLETLKQA